jgi:S-adenosylmethionine decarboxylase
VAVGQSWSLDVGGVPAASLAGERGLAALQGLFAALVDELGLHPVDEPVWHVFPGPHAGVTGIIALSESHLSCHSFPEHEGLTLDLYTCRPRRAPDWAALIARHLGGSPEVVLRNVSRSIPGRHGTEGAR